MRLIMTTFDEHGDEVLTRRGWVDDFFPTASLFDGDGEDLE